MSTPRSLEHQGRLTRRDGRPANPGTYTLRFSLHPGPESGRELWVEDVPGVEVIPGGFFRVPLGEKTPLDPALFEEPRWLVARVVRGREVEEESIARVALTGTSLLLWQALDELREGQRELDEALKRRVEAALERLAAVEGGPLARLEQRVSALEARLGALDGEGRRLDEIEARLEDLDGPEGDAADLTQRLDELEERLLEGRFRGKAPAGTLMRLEQGLQVVAADRPADTRVVGVMDGEGRVAVSGVLLCKVEALELTIQPGDPLVSSAVVGHGRRLVDPPPGTVFAKALEGLASGKGSILVLLR